MRIMSDQALILASSSPYRAELLKRLNLPFEGISPDIDESRRSDETPYDYVLRLSFEKAKEIAKQHPDALIIGSDQCAVHQSDILGKPDNVSQAEAHLAKFSGDAVVFFTGLCLIDGRRDQVQLDVVPYSVHFRELSSSQISTYVKLEKPLDCAGSFKSEGLGVTLFERMSGDDPTALIGLPLIKLTSFLAEAGVTLPVE